MSNRLRTVSSERTYGAEKVPLWSLSFRIGGTRGRPSPNDALDRALSLRDTQRGGHAQSVLVWRGATPLMQTGNARSLNIPGLTLSSNGNWSTSAASGDVILRSRREDQAQFVLQHGLIEVGLGNADRTSFTRLRDFLQVWLQPTREVAAVNLRLRSDGLVFDATSGWPHFESRLHLPLLLTSDETGHLVLRLAERPTDTPVELTLLVQQLNAVANMASGAQWCDWSWQRPVQATDVRVPVEADSTRYLQRPQGKGRAAWLTPDLATAELRDQAPGGPLTALSRMELDAQRIEVAFGGPPHSIQSVTLSRGKEGDHALAYFFDSAVAGGVADEHFDAAKLQFRVDARSLQTRLQALRSDGRIRRGFIPVAQGWAQVDLPDVPSTSRDAARNAGRQVDATVALGDGAIEIGTRRAEREMDSGANESLPWSMRLAAVGAFTLRFALDMAGGRISRINGTVAASSLRIRGLLWMAVGRPDDDELLPRLALGSSSMRDLEFIATEEAVGGEPAWQVGLTDLRVHRQAGTTWPIVSCRAIELGDLNGAPVLWARHPTLPAVQIQPLTAARETVARPLANRELLPLSLGTEGKLRLTRTDTPAWPQVEPGAPITTAFWWPAGAPSAGGSIWPEDPENDSIAAGSRRLDRGFALAALSMPGVEFWSSRSLGGFTAALRIDLPYCDEFHASVRPPRQGEAPERAAITPDIALGADRAVRQLWLGRHDAWMLSLGRSTLLMDRSGSLRSDALLPGVAWGGSVSIVQVASPREFGAVRYEEHGALLEDASGDELLRGLHGGIQFNGSAFSLRDTAADPQMAGFSLPLLTVDGAEFDGDGTRVRDSGNLVDVENTEYLRLTLDRAAEFSMPAGRSWRFWCRELPGVTSGNGEAFSFIRANWPGDTLPTALAGFEWRLYEVDRGQPGGLQLGSDLIFDPLLLRKAERESGVWTIEVQGRVRPCVGALQNGPALGEVTLTLTQQSTTLALVGMDVVVPLIWPLDGLVTGPGAEASLSARRPWLELELGKTAGIERAQLNIPLLGKWRRLPLTRSTAVQHELCMEYATGDTVKATLFPCGEARFDVTLEVKAGPLELVVQRYDSHSGAVAHRVRLKRFPGSATENPASIELPGFDVLSSAGLSLVHEREVGQPFDVTPGFQMTSASERWWLGLGLDLGEQLSLQVTKLYLEGRIEGPQGGSSQGTARVDVQLTRASTSGDPACLVRIHGDWRVDSVIRWPTIAMANGTATSQLPEYLSRMWMHWRGEVLEGRGIVGFDGQGKILLEGVHTPSLFCTHEFVKNPLWASSQPAVSFNALHSVFIGSLETLKAEVARVGAQTLPQIFEAKNAASRLCGLIGAHFSNALEQVQGTDAKQRVVAAAPMLCVDGQPGVLAVLSLPAANGELVNRLANALGWPLDASVDIEPMEAQPQPVSPLVPIAVSARSAAYEANASQLAPVWASLERGRVPRAGVDAAWLGVHQQQWVESGTIGPYAGDKPLLRSMLWLSRLLASAGHGPAQQWLTAAVTEGPDPRWIVFDAAAMVDAATVQDVFESAPSAGDVIGAGEQGMLWLPDVATEADAHWLAGTIATRVGRPLFALRRRMVNGAPIAEPIPLPTEDIEQPSPVAHRAWSEADVELGPARPPIEFEGRAAAFTLSSVLLHREPLQFNVVAATRHQYRGPRMAESSRSDDSGSDRVWRRLQDNVQFAAPRPARRARAAVRSTWTISPTVLPAQQRSEAEQQLAHPYVETVSFAQRCGVLRTHREGFELQTASWGKTSVASEVGRSMARAFRAPRPLPLPVQRQCHGLLDPESNFDFQLGIADLALTPDSSMWVTKPTREVAPQPTEVSWWPTRFTLKEPSCGLLRSDWAGEFLIGWEQPREPRTERRRSSASAAAWAWTAGLVIGGEVFPLRVAVSPNVLKLTLDGDHRPVWPAEGLDVHGTVVLSAASSSEEGALAALVVEPAVSATLPVVLVPERQYTLPMTARTVTFEDSELNALLASEVAASGADDSRLRLLLDRRTYNATGPLVLMVQEPSSTPGAAVVSLERLRLDARTRTTRPQPLTFRVGAGARRAGEMSAPCNQPVRIELGTLSDPEDGAGGVVLAAGDLLRVSAQVGTARMSVIVAVTSEPVLPAPGVAYALWRIRAGQSAPTVVSCPLYGLGVAPDRIELRDAATDLKLGFVRREAVFRWIVVEPSWESSSTFFVQRIDHAGSTHFPVPVPT